MGEDLRHDRRWRTENGKVTLCTLKGIGLLLALRNPNAPRSFFFICVGPVFWTGLEPLQYVHLHICISLLFSGIPKNHAGYTLLCARLRGEIQIKVESDGDFFFFIAASSKDFFT